MTDAYGNLERLRLVTNALPLPVNDITPTDPLLSQPSFYAGFTLPETLEHESEALDCFLSGEDGKAALEILGARVEIRGSDNLNTQNRIRLNCTLPVYHKEDRTTYWRWFGRLYHRAEN